jgi:alanine racemase
LYPETQFDIVRPGIALYGYSSSPELAYGLKVLKLLKPVLSWRTRLCQIKSVPEGESIGYGLTFKTTRDTRLGILPIGYYDGFDRKLSNLGFVLVHGKRAPIVGRVCMNFSMIDLTDVPEAAWNDTVTLIGTDGNETITADHLASQVNTIPYEILARLNPCIARVIV